MSEKPSRRRREPSPRESLPFVKCRPPAQRGLGLDCWNVRPTGDYCDDNILGAAYARVAIVYMRRRRDPSLLIAVTESLAINGDLEATHGLRVGFWTAIGAALIGRELLDG